MVAEQSATRRRTGRLTEVEQHYSYKEAAKLLSLSVATLRRQVALGGRTQGREGIYPICHISRQKKVIPASSLSRYLESRHV